MFKLGKIRYLLGILALFAVSAAVIFFFMPSLRGSGPPPKTVGGDSVTSGSDFLSGRSDGTNIASGPAGPQALTLDAQRPQGQYVSDPVQADYDFNAVGLHWLADVPAGAGVKAELRFSSDGNQWGDWQPVPLNDLDYPDEINNTKSAGETIGQLVFTDRSRFFQYRLTLTASPSGQVPDVSRMTASYIDAKGYHEPSVSLSAMVDRAKWALGPAQASAEPGIISRAQWGADESLMNWTPEYTTPRKFIIHHTVTMNYDPDPAATVRSIYYYHAVSLGWGDIGYNYLVDWQGNVYEGRAGGASAPPGQTVIGGHALSWNPGTIGISAMGNYDIADITGAMYNAIDWLMILRANQYQIDPLGAYPMNGVTLPNILGHRDVYQTACPGQYLYAHIPQLRADVASRFVPSPPNISNTIPTGETSNNRPLISADLSSVNGINTDTIVMRLDGQDVSAGATRAQSYVSYRPPQALSAGTHNVYLQVSNPTNTTQTASWSFTVAATSYTPHDYYWSWYDAIGGGDWVLMANPSSAAGDVNFDVTVAGKLMDMSANHLSGAGCPGSGDCPAGQVPPGRTLANSFGGVIGGPVDAMSLTGDRAVLSQRVLWGPNSLEELPAIDADKLSDHYYWTWYDNLTPGYSNWVLVANHNTASVYYEIRVAGQLRSTGTLPAGASVTPTFPGVQGGPVEVQAWTDSGKSAPANVVASQRVLTAGGNAFNEVQGIPAEAISDHYYWTWYDNLTPGFTNWVLVANRNNSPVYYEIKVAGQLRSSGTIPAGANATPTFPGVQGGPVEVESWTDSSKVSPAKVVASQRVLIGPSFEEVPGYNAGDLNPSYAWTWYDNASAGFSNWVLVANPNPAPAYYEIKIAGQAVSSGIVGPGANVTPTFPGNIGGPVEVDGWTDEGKSQPMDLLASQRVLLNGYFNEVMGSTSSFITNASPTGETSNNRPVISADVSSANGINTDTVVMRLDGEDVSAGATRTQSYISYRPPQSLGAGTHNVYLQVSNSAGTTQTASWSFTVSATSYAPRDYYWSWYDAVSSNDWVLMANPSSATAGLNFDVTVGGKLMDMGANHLSGAGCPGSGSCAAGQVPAGRTLAGSFSGVQGGPVDAMSITGDKAVLSQRIVWGNSSLEELPATDADKLSDHYYWAWYDNLTPGDTNWVLVANHNTSSIYYEIRVAGQLSGSGTLAAGASVTPTFPGVQGGPVEVQAWTDSGKSAPAKVVATQRVLDGQSFNEVQGTPAEALSDHYYWTWYDNLTPGYTNWVLVANNNSSPVYYEIKVAGQLESSGTIGAGANVTPTFPGVQGGPVEVQAWTDQSKVTPASVVSSERVLNGPSFEEVPGYNAGDLNSSYAWTWYDNASPGYANWVLVANPNPVPAYYQIKIAGQAVSSGTIPAGANVTPTFPGWIGGPVEVQAWMDPGHNVPLNILASQRVLLNGYFNELMGTVYRQESGTIPAGPSATVTADSDYQVKESGGNVLTTLSAGQTATTVYANNLYYLITSTGYMHVGASYLRMEPVSGNGIMQVTSYHDIPSWNPSLDDNRFRGLIEVHYSTVSNKLWVINELPIELYLRGIAETGTGSPAGYYKVMSVAARDYALWNVNSGGKDYGQGHDIFHLKNSRNGNGDDQQYKGYGLEVRFPDLTAAVDATTGQVITYNGDLALATYFSQSDGHTRSAQEVWGTTSWPWLQSVPDPDCNGMQLLGHGVGLSAYGALQRAGRGDTYQSILTYYYTGTAVSTMDTNKVIRVAITPVN